MSTESSASPSNPIQIASEIVSQCVANKSEAPFVKFLNSEENLELIVDVIKSIGEHHLKKNDNQGTNNIATDNHLVAAKIMMCQGAMLERGFPCAEVLAPIFLERIYTAMTLAANDNNKDALAALNVMYLPIVAAFSVSKQVRLQKSTIVSQELRQLLTKMLDEGVASESLSWLQRMINIDEGEHVVIIEPSTSIGAIFALSGISDVAQLQVLLNMAFPLSKDETVATDAAQRFKDQVGQYRRHPLKYSWNCWNGRAGADLDPASQKFVNLPHIFRCMISSEASIDEIPFVTLLQDDETKSSIRHRVILLAPPLYQRSIDPKGVFHNMQPDVELVQRLSDGEIAAWLKSCAHLALVEDPMSDEEKAKHEANKRPYGK